jgi:NAD(P)-dependent dehydrogenase (short-subunit alcohol dehydrogenase family)
MFSLKGKAALVAGGAGYLGRPICKALAEQGAAVMIADLNDAQIKKAVSEVEKAYPGAKVKGMVMDIGDERSVKTAVDQTVKELGALDICVNCTCKSVGKLVEDITCAEFDDANHVNITGSFFLARESGRVMKRGGSIIVFSSMYGQVAPDPGIYVPPMTPNPIEYGVAKAALIQMVKYLSTYWGARGIRVNAIAPGPFPHPDTQKEDPDFIVRLAKKTPLGRIGREHETAGAVVFLASEESSYMTGQTLAVNGGWTAW